MQTDCLHCANWRISEKRKDGKTYLIAMAEHHYGLCRNYEVWDLFGKSYVCGKFKTAAGVVVEQRKKEMDK